ncbi:MAG: hypothetical protein WC073_10865 [Sterolibacterium sp.]
MIFSGQGPIFLGDFDAVNGNTAQGYLVNMKKIGCGNRTLKTSFSQDTQKVKESCSGQRLTQAILEKGKEASVTLEMHDFDRAMLAMSMYGTSALTPASTVTAEAFPSVAAGDVVHTKHPKITSVVIKDSNATPATLVEGTNYTVDSADHGRINIISVTGLTLPLKADYAYAAYGNIAAFNATSVVKGLIMDVLNTADGSKARVTIPKIKFSPTKDFNWLGDDEAVLSLEGEMLYVGELAADGDYGPFMRIDGLAA